MLKKEANKITGGLSAPGKMPEGSYNIPASACQTGAILREVPDTPCHECYAFKNRYNFVEVKNTRIDEGAQANHLAYLGDGEVGARSNIGAGTIFCNYNGYEKNKTILGENAFIGSNSSLVAPVRIGAKAMTGSGSVITEDVEDGALALGRARQVTLKGWAFNYHDEQSKKKQGK